MPLNDVIASRPTVDAKAFEILVRLHHRRLLAYALSLTRRADVAEDLAQEALLIAHRDLTKFDASRDFGAWVRGIVRMKYLEWARSIRIQRLEGAMLDSIDRHHRAWDQAIVEGRQDALAAIRECLRLLSRHMGDTVELFYTENRSCAEIAARLGTSGAVIRKRLQRARECLADCIRRRVAEVGE